MDENKRTCNLDSSLYMYMYIYICVYVLLFSVISAKGTNEKDQISPEIFMSPSYSRPILINID